jgi:hypothetical protein
MSFDQSVAVISAHRNPASSPATATVTTLRLFCGPAGTVHNGRSLTLRGPPSINKVGQIQFHPALTWWPALNIPARYVFGYLPDMDVPPDPVPMDLAAWMEVWRGDRGWSGFDLRNNRRRKGRLLIGRDATRPTWRW